MRVEHGRVLAVAAICAAFAVLAAGSASGATVKKKKKKPGPVKVVSSTPSQVSGNQSIATATATCPKGTRATGGGFSATPSSLDVVFHVYESQKVGQNQWRVSAQIADTFGPSDPAVLTTQVYCRKRAPKTTTVLSTVSTTGSPGGAGPPVTASCAKGKALAGGFLVPASVQATGVYANIVTDSTRIGTESWQVNVESTTGSPPGTATSYAYCAKVKKPQKLPKPSAVTSPPNSSLASPVTVAAPCTGKVGPVAGGFTQTGVSATNALYMYESVRNGNSSQASAVHAGVPVPSTLTAIAYCG